MSYNYNCSYYNKQSIFYAVNVQRNNFKRILEPTMQQKKPQGQQHKMLYICMI